MRPELSPLTLANLLATLAVAVWAMVSSVEDPQPESSVRLELAPASTSPVYSREATP